MIEDAMRSVKAAEEKASVMVQNAKNEAEKIRRASEEKCENLVQRAETDAKQREADRLSEIEKNGEVSIANAREAAEVKAEELKKAAAEKENEAIDAVIDKLLG